MSVTSGNTELDDCERLLLSLTGNAAACSDMMRVWDTGKQEAFTTALNTIVKDLVTLRDTSHRIDPALLVPVDVLSRIDEGVNPDTYTRNRLDEARQHNDTVRGRVHKTELLASALDAQLTAWQTATGASQPAKGASGT